MMALTQATVPDHIVLNEESSFTEELINSSSRSLSCDFSGTSDGSVTPVDFSESFLADILDENTKPTGLFGSECSTSTQTSEKSAVPQTLIPCDIESPDATAGDTQVQELHQGNPVCKESGHLLYTSSSFESRDSYNESSIGSSPNSSACRSSPTSVHSMTRDHAHVSCDSILSNGYFSYLNSFGNGSQLCQPASSDLQKTAIICAPESDSSSTKSFTEVLEKPKESFLTLVAKAILSSNGNSMVLSEIYDWILQNYPYFQNAKCAWQSSVRHSLSVNECFVKGKRAKNGRGFVWSIHPICIESFKKGDFDRRTARRIVQKSTQAMTTAIEELQKLTKTVQSSGLHHYHFLQQQQQHQQIQSASQQYNQHTLHYGYPYSSNSDLAYPQYAYGNKNVNCSPYWQTQYGYSNSSAYYQPTHFTSTNTSSYYHN